MSKKGKKQAAPAADATSTAL